MKNRLEVSTLFNETECRSTERFSASQWLAFFILWPIYRQIKLWQAEE